LVALTREPRPVNGILAMALQAVAEYRDGRLVPTADADEAAVVEGVSVYLVGGPSRGGGIPLRRG
jgi:magnesium chelatase family protein